MALTSFPGMTVGEDRMRTVRRVIKRDYDRNKLESATLQAMKDAQMQGTGMLEFGRGQSVAPVDPYKDFMHQVNDTMAEVKEAIMKVDKRVQCLESGGNKSPLLSDNPLFKYSTTFR